MAPEQERRVTLREVAVAARVSIGTASHALTGALSVRPETRARVLAVAQGLNYVPDRNAARLLHGRTECIGIAFSMEAACVAGDTFYATVVRGITVVVEEHGYTLRFIQLHADAAVSPHRTGRTLNSRDVDGLIVLNGIDSALMTRLRTVGVPLVCVDASGAFPDIPSIDNDDRGGVASGVRYLIDLGHRDIALLNMTLAHPFARESLSGYLQAMEEASLTVAPWLVRTSALTITDGRLAMAEVLAGTRRPTAVFAVSDDLAVGAMQAIQEAGLRIPDDISVVGMDDIPLAAQVRPALTTVRIDMDALGRRAAESVLDLIAGRAGGNIQTALPTHLIVRDSAAPPPSRADECTRVTGGAVRAGASDEGSVTVHYRSGSTALAH